MKRFQKAILVLCALLTLIVLPLYGVKVWRKDDYTDFSVYYLAAERAQAGEWDQIYTLADGASPFRYVPLTLPLLHPLANLPAQEARLAWYGLQVLWFAAGFFFLYLCGRRVSRENALWATALSYLFILRFCLDTFTIGQISSLMFMAFCAGLWAWQSFRPGLAGSMLMIPTALKIGPGFLLLLLARFPFRQALRATLISVITIALLFLVTALYVGPERYLALWENWIRIVAADSQYFDASHYGSQSVKSALLRLANLNWLTHGQVIAFYLASALLGCGAVPAFWMSRSPVSALGRASLYSLGVFPYLWFMPETFKYSLTTLAIPIFLLLIDSRRTRFGSFALIFALLTLSLAGKDIVGSWLFFSSQRASLPLIATFLLFWASWRQARRETRAATWLAPALGAWDREAAAVPEKDASLLISIPRDQRYDWVRDHTLETLSALKERHSSVEVLFVPEVLEIHRDRAHWAKLPLEIPEARLLPNPLTPGRGAALREAFLASRGRQIFILSAEQPCHPDFFSRASELLTQGWELVRGNRRLPDSRFRIPVRVLPRIYGRHRFGVRFNSVVRRLLPVIQTSDTQASNLALSRGAAFSVFVAQSTPGFLFDLELSLIARLRGFRERDLPITLLMNEEKRASRVFSEILQIAYGLPRVVIRHFRGYYKSIPAPTAISADDWGLSPGVNEGILQLVEEGVIRRVSLLADCRSLGSKLDQLKDFALSGKVELGLHFNLTYGKSFGASPLEFLWNWIRSGGARSPLAALVSQEFTRQLDVLRTHGVSPSYLDGHHHVHVAPGLLELIAPGLRKAGITQVRLPYDRSLWLTPKAILNLLSLLARGTLKRHGFKALRFSYPQARDFRDPGRLRALVRRERRSEIIVHPARRSDFEAFEYPDPYREERVIEYHSLRMLQYAEERPQP